MSLTFEEIAIAFSNCNSDAKTSFKNHLVNLYKSKEDYEKGFIISDVNNYILTDIEKLLSKAVLNICAADNLIKQGYFSWGFVTSYYANFFLIQGLNRTQLNFTTWVSRSIDCVEKDYRKKNLHIIGIANSSDEHQRQFKRFFENFSHFRNRKGIDRYWNIGIQSFELGNESEIRNRINYEIRIDAFYELDLDIVEFRKIIRDNQYSPFTEYKENSQKFDNYSRRNLKLAIARLRMLTYTLNFIAVRNLEYQSYYQRNMKNRLKAIDDKYPDVSKWIKELFQKWLIFDSELVEEDVIS
ncbi:hypothetical protein PN497_02240 [Sphaerospermopsis kisseleviana CS-549]|uniref:Uncharacterized protein n=1 Tax=Sphaerospermopsis kisseleviana CS-549 TaxID=3021783 RepID=A0ABT4ZLE9_9CYAN|nr:hypothetical protein [Sphaerospermopsis kisseleviana]MDB9440203.1 hypothetical protein [Sphaerospermopsis kisseleviana CS-549]BAZ82661.1 hypothetical protein NIES73_39440 [Sphaerospermopsis kisseleviana NIES-73]